MISRFRIFIQLKAGSFLVRIDKIES